LNFANNGYRPAYYNHPGMYHGYWNANRGYGYGGLGYGGLGYGLGYGGYGSGYGRYGLGYGGYGPGWGLGYGSGPYGYYGYRPFGWGLAGWGLGSLLYNSGYLGYSNPYYGAGYGGYSSGYTYAQPIPVTYNDAYAVQPQSGATSADDILNSAVAAFKQNDYDTALSLANQGIQQYPSDSVMHEFRALVLFAKGDYKQAAATIHSVLAVGPGWDWTTLSGLYNDVAVYTTQLRALEAAVRQTPNDGAGRFLLAYHYMSDGYPDSAVKQLQQVVQLVPNDKVANDLLRMMSAPASQSSQGGTPATANATQPTPQPPATNQANAPTQPSGPPIDAAAMVGSWKASRDDGSSFQLTLTADKSFTWSFTQNNQAPQSFDGTYTIEGNALALERKGGGSMVAEITQKNGQFNFKPVGAPPDDPGLNFTH